MGQAQSWPCSPTTLVNPGVWPSGKEAQGLEAGEPATNSSRACQGHVSTGQPSSTAGHCLYAPLPWLLRVHSQGVEVRNYKRRTRQEGTVQGQEDTGLPPWLRGPTSLWQEWCLGPRTLGSWYCTLHHCPHQDLPKPPLHALLCLKPVNKLGASRKDLTVRAPGQVQNSEKNFSRHH